MDDDSSYHNFTVSIHDIHERCIQRSLTQGGHTGSADSGCGGDLYCSVGTVFCEKGESGREQSGRFELTSQSTETLHTHIIIVGSELRGMRFPDNLQLLPSSGIPSHW